MERGRDKDAVGHDLARAVSFHDSSQRVGCPVCLARGHAPLRGRVAEHRKRLRIGFILWKPLESSLQSTSLCVPSHGRVRVRMGLAVAWRGRELGLHDATRLLCEVFDRDKNAHSR